MLNSDGTVKAEAKVSSTDDYGFDTLTLLDDERFGRALGFVGYMTGDGSQVLALGAGAGSDGGGAIWLLQFETPAVSFLLGDANGDGGVNNQDIAAFALALFDRSMYSLMYPNLNPNIVLDFDGDGAFNNRDIAGFATALGF